MGNTPSPIIVSALGALLVATSCAGPPAQPLETQALAETVVGRSTASREVLVAAISLYGAPPLGLTLSDDLDPTRDGFWHAHALAFEPVVRSSRRIWRATEREQAGAGTPNRTGLSHRLEDLSDLERQNDVAATVDLLGLLGLGPKAAEIATLQSRTSTQVGLRMFCLFPKPGPQPGTCQGHPAWGGGCRPGG